MAPPCVERRAFLRMSGMSAAAGVLSFLVPARRPRQSRKLAAGTYGAGAYSAGIYGG